jgi:DNA-binding transcriptional ArsR family regulator
VARAVSEAGNLFGGEVSRHLEDGHATRDRSIDIDRLFHALGDPTRRAILDRLSGGPMSVSRLAGPLEITVTAVAQHLLVLEECALVRTEKLGRVRTCRIAPEGFSALERWIREHRSQWERRLDRLGDMLTEDEEGG